MAWLRLDDGFASHPKIARLTDRDFRTWVRVLCYCAFHKTDGVVDSVAIRGEIRGVTPAFLKRCYDLHLLDEIDGEYVIHDWSAYNPKDPTKAERQARWRDRRASTPPSTQLSTDASTQASPAASTGVSTRARVRARVPSPPPKEHTPAPVPEPVVLPTPDGAGAGAGDLDSLDFPGALRAVGPTSEVSL